MLGTIITFLITYKYLLLYPVAFVEGNIITIICGFLVREGYLSFIISGIVIVCANLTGDIVLYWLGHKKGEKFVSRWGKYFGINEGSIARAKDIFTKHHTRILFLSKVTNGFGLAMVILFTAGMSRIPFSIYLIINIIGEFVWTFALLTLGYFFGHLYATIDNVLSRAGLVVGLIVIVFLFLRFRKYLQQKI